MRHMLSKLSISFFRRQMVLVTVFGNIHKHKHENDKGYVMSIMTLANEDDKRQRVSVCRTKLSRAGN